MSRAGSVLQVQKKKKKIELDFVRVVLIACIVYFVYTFIVQQFSLDEYDVKIADIENKIESANDRVEEIEILKEKANTTEFMEDVARTELGLVKPYEKVFIDVSK